MCCVIMASTSKVGIVEYVGWMTWTYRVNYIVLSTFPFPFFLFLPIYLSRSELRVVWGADTASFDFNKFSQKLIEDVYRGMP